jgi:hypothetical protein
MRALQRALFSLTEEIALQLGVSQGTTYALLHDILGFHKFCKVGAQKSDRRE